MAKEEGATGTDSPTDKSTGDPSSGGKPTQKSVETLLEEMKAENSRKAKEIEKLRTDREEMQQVFEQRLSELENKTRLSKSEKEEKGELEQLVANIAADQRSRAWRELSKRDAREVFEERFKDKELLKSIVDTVDYEYAMDQLEELAEKEGVEVEELGKTLAPYVRRFQGKPTIRQKKAYAAYLEDKKIKEELKRLKQIPTREAGYAAPSNGKRVTLDEARKSGNMDLYLKQIADTQEKLSAGKRTA